MAKVGGSSEHVKSGVASGLLKSTWAGLKSMRMQGNVNQQGGAFVLKPGADGLELLLAHHDDSPQDHIGINKLLEAAGCDRFEFE
eukprot:m.378921 g.378921  ORF g.378921 m.378921 type:complete len:85 (-) comp20027_c4_seq14:81-335(-)